jgi:D-alanyl-lipoteichoic acid acyltransferase DltB (MBOAT superfamily)
MRLPESLRRLSIIAALFVLLVALERQGLVSLLAWTDRIFPSSRYPWLFGLLLAACAAIDLLGERRRKAVLIVTSAAAICVFDLRFAAICGLFFAAYYLVVFSRAHRHLKLAFLIATLAGWGVLCNELLLADLHRRHPWLAGFGYMFAVNFTFRLFRFHHEMRVRGFTPVPYEDYLLYFLFAPFFVVVPYMLAIPRFDAFAAGLARRDPAVEQRGIRHLAIGLAFCLAASIVARVYHPREAVAQAIGRGAFWLALPMGLLNYPVWAVLESVGPAHLLVGLLGIFGIRIAPAFDRPLLSTGILDWWRRWNVHFRELLVDLFFYPIALRWRRRRYLGIVLACAAVFLVGSTLFHYPKHYFALGSHVDPNVHLLVENGVFFVIVAIALCLEKRRGRAQPCATGPRRVGRMVGTWAAVFVIVVILGYGSGWATKIRPVEQAAARVAEATAVAARGEIARAWELAAPSIEDLWAATRRAPRDPGPRVLLARALSFGGGLAAPPADPEPSERKGVEPEREPFDAQS